MNDSCSDFRSALESKLSGRATARELCELSWHEHVLGCAACQTLLQEEEALEIVLSTLPDPVLPAQLAERVLARLRTARDDASRLRDDASQLEELLEIAGDVMVPADLATNLLDRLRASPSSRPEVSRLRLVTMDALSLGLDELLELDRELEAPQGLARRVLGGLKAERAVMTYEIDGQRPRRRIRPAAWAWPLAAGVLVALGWIFWTRSPAARAKLAPAIVHVDENPASNATPDDPDLDLLASLDVLEDWNAVMQDDLDVELSTFEPADEVLLDYSNAEPTPDAPSIDPESQGASQAPSKG